jgi:nucleotide-binding universal stress UspA family protein
MQEIKKILVPVDFSEDSGKVLKAAAMVAGKFGAAIDVVFVVESLGAYAGFAVPHLPLADLEKDLHTRAERKMDEFLDIHMDRKIPHTGRVLNGNPAEQIVQYAGTENCDLIAMGTRACRGTHKALFGSVTDRVIKTAPCPVLSMNPCG